MYTDPSGEQYIDDYGNTHYTNGDQNANAQTFKQIWDNVIKPWTDKNLSARNFDEAGTAVGKAARDAVNFVSKNVRSALKSFTNLFKKSFRYEVPKVAYVNYSAVNTMNTISNNFTAGSTVASGGFQSNYRGNGNKFNNRQEVLDYFSDKSNFDSFGNEPQFYTKYDTRFEALASFFQIVGPEIPTSVVKSISNLFSLNKVTKEVTVIGEGMARVETTASKIANAKILNDMPEFSGTADQITSQMMTYNRQWILQQMRSGRSILDIGRDLNRVNPSIFYQMELNMIKNYLKLHPNSLKIIKR